ncbi:hypothetical protein IVB30_31220 [Bradyrhizobium sp. 200]|uniref:hypothetical protein n=1 Tax=Bradyrhizobium sp. 200 TaxID=2782665 RepID=UPI001FFE6C17|nr:hypothetical protein [Bradyrhizobium sp. 200]UPJ47694.1 hypothetical protein IVB30_31220 [Bradyrhizobium sp. 200]
MAMSETNGPALEMLVASARKNWGVRMNFSSSKDQSYCLFGKVCGGKCWPVARTPDVAAFLVNNLRTYAQLLRSEMDRRELKYTPIDWSE